MTKELRFTVKTDVPHKLRELGFTAYVADAGHPDGDGESCSLSWHTSLLDAERVAVALNYHHGLVVTTHERLSKIERAAREIIGRYDAAFKADMASGIRNLREVVGR